MFQASTFQRRERTPITTPAAEWTGYCRRFTVRTRQHYREVLCKFLATLPKGLAIGDLNRGHIERYITKLLLAGRSNRTANAHLTVLKSFCRYLSESYGVPKIPTGPMLREDPPQVRFLTRDEYAKVLSACTDGDGRIKDQIEFLAMTGLRASEFCSLTWDCVSPQLTTITITGKGRKRRTIPLNATCREILKPGKINFTKSRKQLYRLCRRMAEKAGIEGFGPHALRRYFATELLRRGVSIDIISKLLGHSSIKTTERYISYHPSFLLGSTDCLDD